VVLQLRGILVEHSSAKAVQPTLESLVGKKWISLVRFADLAGVSYQTAMRWIKPGKDGEPPRVVAVKVGGTYRVYEEEVAKFLQGTSPK